MIGTLPTLLGTPCENKRVLVRCDFNVPMRDGVVEDSSRIIMTLPTLEYLLDRGNSLVLMSHLGRPEGKTVEELRLHGVGKVLESLLKRPVQILKENSGEKVKSAVEALKPGEVLLLENIQFHPGEKANDEGFARELASFGELYVNDAFAQCHRPYASLCKITEYIPSVAGLLLEKEVRALSKVLTSPVHPTAVIIGGAKIDTKIGVIKNLLEKADTFIFGGGIANTFLHAEGYQIGKSLAEREELPLAQELLLEMEKHREKVFLPEDVLVSDSMDGKSVMADLAVEGVGEHMYILDMGSASTLKMLELLGQAKRIIWNGPLGYTSLPQSAQATKRLAEALRTMDAEVIIGGGDTLEVLQKLGIHFDEYSHVSSGGGAMLEYLEGKTLPGIAALEKK